ncbi:MAG: hypothetical protein ACOC9R_02735 [bacterium]
MTTVLDRVPVDRVAAEAREIQFRRTALTLLAGLFFVVGWVAGKTLGAVWLAVAWSAAAVKVGWQEARRPPPDGGG